MIPGSSMHGIVEEKSVRSGSVTSASDPSWRRLYPFASHFLNLGALRYHYLDEGAGEPVVMVHGNPTWSFYFRNLILALRGEYRCIVPDHIGCGLSDKPQDWGYRIADHSAGNFSDGAVSTGNSDNICGFLQRLSPIIVFRRIIFDLMARGLDHIGNPITCRL
jgi:hypothetical protein